MDELKFNVPNHEAELEQASSLLKRIGDKVALGLGEDRAQSMLQLTTDILYLVGELSQDIFDLRITMETEYNKYYSKSPALGKKLYLEHYQELHKPYDKLKNRAFKLIKMIDPTNEGIEEEIYV